MPRPIKVTYTDSSQSPFRLPMARYLTLRDSGGEAGQTATDPTGKAQVGVSQCCSILFADVSVPSRTHVRNGFTAGKSVRLGNDRSSA